MPRTVLPEVDAAILIQLSEEWLSVRERVRSLSVISYRLSGKPSYQVFLLTDNRQLTTDNYSHTKGLRIKTF